MPGRDRGLERLWRRRVGAQRTSGLSVRAFCARHGLPESAFYFWRRELERRDAERTQAAVVRRPRQRSAADARPRFVPVVVTEGPASVAAARATSVLPASPPAIELVHPGGVVVRVPAGTDTAALRTILGVLDERRGVSADRPAEAP
jgi:transposase-like protein